MDARILFTLSIESGWEGRFVPTFLELKTPDLIPLLRKQLILPTFYQYTASNVIKFIICYCAHLNEIDQHVRFSKNTLLALLFTAFTFYFLGIYLYK